MDDGFHNHGFLDNKASDTIASRQDLAAVGGYSEHTTASDNNSATLGSSGRGSAQSERSSFSKKKNGDAILEFLHIFKA